MAHGPADSMNCQPFSQEGDQFTPSRSCHECCRRKVRCSKAFPCGNCVRLGFVCTFPSPGRRPRRIQNPSSTAKLSSRLGFLERKVEELIAESVTGFDSAHSQTSRGSQGSTEDNQATSSLHPGTHSIYPNGSIERRTEIHDELKSTKATPSTLGHQIGRLVVDQSNGSSRYLDHQVLVDLGDQIKELQTLFDSSSPAISSEENTYPPGSTTPYSKMQSFFPFGHHSLACSLRYYHPSPTGSHLLLNVFEANIAPIVMIIHKPTLRNLIQTACSNLEELDRSSEALVFCVYFAAASSMTPQECLHNFGEDHATLVERYRFAVEQALARAGFLYTHKLVVLQAAVLFLACARQPNDARFVWTMIAVVTRLSLSLGLHRDGSRFGLSPFETEMRRRLWWYISLLDSQSSDNQATAPNIREGDYDTRLPLNINDDDLSVESPQERKGFTEMTLFLLRCEILISSRKLMQITSPGLDGQMALLKSRELAIEETRRVLRERYLQFCDFDIPIQWVTATIARVALARLWLVSNFSLLTAEGFDVNLWPDRRELLCTAIEVLESVYLLETHGSTAKWSWLFEGYFQWHSFAYVLSELCVRPTSPLSDLGLRKEYDNL